MAAKTKKAKRARKYEVWVKAEKTGTITVKAKSPAEAKKLAEEYIEEAWDADDAAEWHDVDKCDIDVLNAYPMTGRRR
jgi:hypothetical protein